MGVVEVEVPNEEAFQSLMATCNYRATTEHRVEVHSCRTKPMRDHTILVEI